MAGWQKGAVEGERPMTSGGKPMLEPCVSQGLRGQAMPGLANPTVCDPAQAGEERTGRPTAG